MVDIESGRAAELAKKLSQHYGHRAAATVDVATALRGPRGLIHATSTGTDKLPGMPLPAELLRPDLWVADVVYFPIETELLKTARVRGCATPDGAGMAVGQAAGAVEFFTGMRPDAARMEGHFRSLLKGQAGVA